MFGIRYLKASPTTYVLQYRNGRPVREGAGLSFFYNALGSTIVLVPLNSVDVPFVFNEATADFQEATIQGELTYRVSNAKRVAEILDHSVDGRNQYVSDDPSKLSDRLIHAAQIHARAFTLKRPLRQLLVSSDDLVREVLAALRSAELTHLPGVEILGLNILSVKPTPEMAKALQAAAREELLREADEATYARRNNAVLLERTIKENELNTEIAMETKRRTVRETQMAAEIAIEEQRTGLVDQRTANERKEADTRAYALQATLGPLKEVDWRTLMAVSGGNDARSLIAMAFRDLADGAEKIGSLNITPDLLSQLMEGKPERRSKG